MATVTPNFNWPVPTSTDLVKDGATAIEALGDSIDASLVDLKGGTTGQVLSKNSNTDMDFVWVTDAAGDITGVTAGTGISGGGTSGTVTVTNSMATTIDAKGDLVPGTGADTFARLAVGANGTVLTADSAETTGLKWATPSGGAVQVIQTITTTSGATNVSFTSIPSTYKNLRIVYSAAITSGAWEFFLMRLNNDTAANYDRQTLQGRTGSATAAETYGATSMHIGNITQTNTSVGQIVIPAYKDTVLDKLAFNTFYAKAGTTSTNQWVGIFGGAWRSTNAITQIDLFPDTSKVFVTGSTFTLYGES